MPKSPKRSASKSGVRNVRTSFGVEMDISAINISTVLRERLTENGVRRAVASASPIKLSQVRGHTFDEVGRSIAALRPIPVGGGKRGVRKAAAKKVKRSDAGHLSAAARRHKPNYWGAVRDEVHVFLCTDDKRYAAIKTQIASRAKGSQTVVIGAISAAIAGSISVPIGAVFPLAALCFLAVLKIGKEAYCKHVGDLQVP
jgi:hypothetical protein